MVIRDLKENKEYAEQISNDPLIGKKSLSSALEVIFKYTGEPFILIMDESTEIIEMKMLCRKNL